MSPGLWRTRSVPAGPSLLAAALAAKACIRAAADAGVGEAGSASSCCDTPLSHSYSSPDLTGGAGLPPTCARSLFGSVNHIEPQPPLMASNSWSSRWAAGHDACGWQMRLGR